MTAAMSQRMRWLEIGAIFALFLVIHVSANDETGKIYFAANTHLCLMLSMN